MIHSILQAWAVAKWPVPLEASLDSPVSVVLLQGTATSSSTFVGSLGHTFKWKHFWWTWQTGVSSCWPSCQLLPLLRHLGQCWFPASSVSSLLLLSQWLFILCQNVPGKEANKRTKSIPTSCIYTIYLFLNKTNHAVVNTKGATYVATKNHCFCSCFDKGMVNTPSEVTFAMMMSEILYCNSFIYVWKQDTIWEMAFKLFVMVQLFWMPYNNCKSGNPCITPSH